MGSVFVIQGILIYIYGFDHNPPHIHVRSGDCRFSITIEERIVEGNAKSGVLKIVNEFIDDHKQELLNIWNNAQNGNKIEKVKR